MPTVPFEVTLGEVLRTVRKDRGLTLVEVSAKSKARFKPSVLGGYERGERAISVARFTELAEFYKVSADRLLSEAVKKQAEPREQSSVVLDVMRLARLDFDQAGVVHAHVSRIRASRGDFGGQVLTLRSGDLIELGFSTGLRPKTLLSRLQPALLESAKGRS